MKILGLDPANKCGFAHSCGEHGTWELANKSDKHPGRRLERLKANLYAMRRSHGIDLLAVEDASFGSKNQNTAAMHNELRGIIKLVAAELELPVVMFKPTQIKKWLTGNGGAKKGSMIHWVKIQFGIETTDDNVADAVAIMEMAKQYSTAGVL